MRGLPYHRSMLLRESTARRQFQKRCCRQSCQTTYECVNVARMSLWYWQQWMWWPLKEWFGMSMYSQNISRQKAKTQYWRATRKNLVTTQTNDSLRWPNLLPRRKEWSGEIKTGTWTCLAGWPQKINRHILIVFYSSPINKTSTDFSYFFAPWDLPSLSILWGNKKEYESLFCKDMYLLL